MSIFDNPNQPDIDGIVEQFIATQGAVLLDVRTAEEYCEGHIESSINIPLHQIESIEQEISDKSTPLFIYCLSGARSLRAIRRLTKMGYCNMTNAGGIVHYHGGIIE